MTYETLAFLNAATSAGRSCVSHRTDDFGSGSRTQMSAVVAVDFALPAVAPPTMRPTARAVTRIAMLSFFTPCPPLFLRASSAGRYSVARTRSNCAARHSGVPDRYLLPLPGLAGHGCRSCFLGPRLNLPGRLEHATQRERRGPANGSAVAEGRGEDDERARPGRERALLERSPDLVDQPRRERPEAASEHDRLEVEDVEGRREGDPEPAARVAHGGDDRLVALLGATDELVGEAAAAPRRGDAGGGCDRLLPDQRFDATSAAAGAAPPVGVDRDVSELTAEPMAAAKEPRSEERRVGKECRSRWSPYP